MLRKLISLTLCSIILALTAVPASAKLDPKYRSFQVEPSSLPLVKRVVEFVGSEDIQNHPMFHELFTSEEAKRDFLKTVSLLRGQGDDISRIVYLSDDRLVIDILNTSPFTPFVLFCLLHGIFNHYDLVPQQHQTFLFHFHELDPLFALFVDHDSDSDRELKMYLAVAFAVFISVIFVVNAKRALHNYVERRISQLREAARDK